MSDRPRDPEPSPPDPTHSTLYLVRAAQDGNAAALERLCARYLPRLTRWARGRLPAHARGVLDTQDLVQDVLIRTLRGLDRLNPERGGCFQAYTRQAILNAVRDQLRKAHGELPLSGVIAEAPHHGPSPLEEAIGRDALYRYEVGLQRLTEAEREMIVARLELHCEYQEIAEICDKPSADAARMAVKRALRRLAEEMGDV